MGILRVSCKEHREDKGNESGKMKVGKWSESRIGYIKNGLRVW